jgi:hypothetical protein
MSHSPTALPAGSPRSFVTTAAGIAALGLFTAASDLAEAPLVWKSSDWKLAEFDKLVHHPARIKQVWDVVNIGGGQFLGSVEQRELRAM